MPDARLLRAWVRNMKLRNMYASSEQSLASDHENSFTEDRVGGRSIHACGRSSRQHKSLRLILARPDTPGKRGGDLGSGGQRDLSARKGGASILLGGGKAVAHDRARTYGP